MERSGAERASRAERLDRRSRSLAEWSGTNRGVWLFGLRKGDDSDGAIGTTERVRAALAAQATIESMASRLRSRVLKGEGVVLGWREIGLKGFVFAADQRANETSNNPVL